MLEIITTELITAPLIEIQRLATCTTKYIQNDGRVVLQFLTLNNELFSPIPTINIRRMVVHPITLT